MARRKGTTASATELQGWPAISRYLGQPISTAQRWRKAGMPVERKGRFAVASPNAMNRWLAFQEQSPEPFHIAHTGERDLVDDLKRGLAAARKRAHINKQS
jgi:hypothetical protein